MAGSRERSGLIDRANLAAALQDAFGQSPAIDSDRIWAQIEPSLDDEQVRPFTSRWLRPVRSIRLNPIHAVGAAAAIVVVLFILVQLNPSTIEAPVRAHESLVQITENSLEDSQLGPVELDSLGAALDAVYVEFNSGLLPDSELPEAIAAVRQVSERLSAHVDPGSLVGSQLLTDLDDLHLLLTGSEPTASDDFGSDVQFENGSGGSDSPGGSGNSSGQPPDNPGPAPTPTGDAKSSRDHLSASDQDDDSTWIGGTDQDETVQDDDETPNQPDDSSSEDDDAAVDDDRTNTSAPDDDDVADNEQEDPSGNLPGEEDETQSDQESDNGETSHTDDGSGSSSRGPPGGSDDDSPDSPGTEAATDPTPEPGIDQSTETNPDDPEDPGEIEDEEDQSESEDPPDEEEEEDSETEGEDD